MGSRDVIGHVTIRLPGVDFLCVVNIDHASIWQLHGDMATQRQLCHEFDLLGLRDVIGHVTIRLPRSASYGWSIVTRRLSGTITEIWRFKYWTHGREHGKEGGKRKRKRKERGRKWEKVKGGKRERGKRKGMEGKEKGKGNGKGKGKEKRRRRKRVKKGKTKEKGRNKAKGKKKKNRKR